jgi:hypothetical protein
MPYDGFAMEYPPDAVPNKGVDAIAIFLCVLTGTTKAESQSLTRPSSTQWKIEQ